MEKKFKFKKEYLIIAILIFVLLFIIYAYGKKINGESLFDFFSNTDTSTSSDTTTSEVNAEIQTITNTLASSGQVSSAVTEELPLHATYYFEEVYFEENDYVAEGENILKYTNGTYLTAPYNLVITGLNVPDAESKCTNQHYIEVQCVDTLTMTASIDEDDLSKVVVGQEAEITLSALEGKTYIGNITNISETAKYSSNGSTFTATITFENDSNVKIGMTASCNIILEKAEDVVAVPVEAVTTSGTTKYVTVVKENKETEQVTVETGISNDAYIEIKSGLSGGETIQITESTNKSTTSSATSGRGSMKQQMMQ